MQQLKVGSLLQNGRYKIEKALGQGGFGITYLATQELLDRKVCVKEFFFKDSCSRTHSGEVVLGTIGNRDLVERFLNKFIKEARTLSQLDHSNIIRVLDFFKENNTAYYVMDFIEGSSLEDIVNSRGALSESVAIEYIKQVANALDYIHQRSVNHLDVKPANIMIRRSDNKAILIDFGVSKQYDSQGEQTSTTPVGISYGYAPIEQYRPGGVITFSPQADIYALGATLYKLVTGKIPPQAMEILNDGLSGLPQSLSLNLANAIRKAMELKKSDRPQSIKEFMNTFNVSKINQKASSFIASNPSFSEAIIWMGSTAHFSKEKFVKIIVDVLGVNPKDVVENASFTNDLGADSLDVVEIIMHIEQEFGIVIDESLLLDANQNEKMTVGDAIFFLEKAILMKSDRPQSVKEFLNIVSTPKQSANEATILIKPTQPRNEINGHEYVDLGLPSGLKWATCNVGANKPEEYGDYFAWGEVRIKPDYTSDNYEYSTLKKGFFGSVKRVFDNIGKNISGTQYDAAKFNWGSSWRLPTEAEIRELLEKCIWTWTTQGSKKGYKVTGLNGNSIFIPAAGWYNKYSFCGYDMGSFWSANPLLGNGSDSAAVFLEFNSGNHNVSSLGCRDHGRSVRPVSN